MDTGYMALINVPSYLGMDDEPPVFDTPAQAWKYLADERERDEVDADDGPGELSRTWVELRDRAKLTSDVLIGEDGTGTVYGDTPGYDGDHDLGLAYSVIRV